MIPVETLFLGVPNLQMDVTVKLMTFAQVQIGLEGGGFSKFCKIVNKQLNNKMNNVKMNLRNLSIKGSMDFL